MKNRILSLVMALVLAVGLLPMGAMATENESTTSITAYVSISKYGTFVKNKNQNDMALVPVELTGKAAYTLDDVLKAAHDTYYEGSAEAGYRSATGKYGLYVTKLWGDESGMFGYQLNRGNVNVMGLNQSVTDGDYIDAYINQSAYPDNEAYTHFDKSTATVYVGAALSLTLEQAGYDENWNTVFSPCADAVITVNGTPTETTTATNGKANITFDTAGTYIVSATKTKTVNNQTVTAITAPVCKVTVQALPDTSITVPSDTTLFVGSKSKHFVPFTEMSAVYTKNNEDGTKTCYYDLKNNSIYNYRVSGAEYVTYAGTFKKAANYTMTVTQKDLQPEGKTKTSVDRDVKSNSGYNVGDIYLNINAQGYLKLDDVGSTYQLVNLRNWEAVDGTTSNYFIEPDYHYTVIDENGAASNVVTVSDDGLVTAVSKGTAIVLVTYDAITIPTAAGGPFFGAIWPENTGVFVVSVEAGDSGITTGMTINEGKNSTDSKLAGDALDAEHDVIYFTGDTGSYTFTPKTTGCTVSVANPTVGNTMSFSGFSSVTANSDGSFTIPLVQGRNIVRLEKDSNAEYQVITAKKVSCTINDGKPVVAGDTVSIVFDTLYHPANKLAGVYNMSAVAVYTNVDGYAGRLAGGTSNQYQFASNSSTQTINGILKRTTDTWGMPSYAKDTSASFIIPSDWAENTFTLSGGTLIALGYGDPYGNHRGITLTDGKAPNFNAAVKEAYLGQLPDIVIPVTTSKTVTSVAITTKPNKTKYFAGDRFDPAGMVVKASYSDNTTNEAVTSYTVSPEILTADTTSVTVTYGGQTASVPVTVTQPKVTSIAITSAPAKTTYTAGDTFDPTGMVVTATYENGKTAPVTSYTYSPNRTLTESDTAMTITYTGSDKTESVTPVTQEITVNAAPAPDPSTPEPQTITVSFTLLGDDAHGTPTESTGTHTLKGDNLDTWIAKSSYTVSKGSTVLDVLVTALAKAGFPYENPTGNYVTSIRGLAEMGNGSLSGWMYTLNGNYPSLGVSEQTLKNGDVIVFHYTDDYTAEKGSEQWNGGSGVIPSKPETPASSLTPEVSANSKGEATVKVDANAVEDSLAQAEKENASALVIAPKVTGQADTVTTQLPLSAAETISQDSDLDLTVQTEDAAVTIPNEALGSIVTQSSGSQTIEVVVKTCDPNTLKDQAAGLDLENAAAVEVTIRSGGSPITTFGGQTLAIDLPVDKTVYTEGTQYKVLVLSADGTVETLTGQCIREQGRLVVRVFTPHLSTFLVTTQTVLPFTDVDGHWALDAIRFVYDQGLMTGTKETQFSPKKPLNRAMLATILYRMEGSPAVTGENPYTDVADGTWYTDAVLWASEQGIVNGYGNGKFGPLNTITREQLAAMLLRYSDYKKYNTDARNDLASYADADDISAWALEALRWANAQGLVTGRTETTLVPQGATTRAETATILMRYLDTIAG